MRVLLGDSAILYWLELENNDWKPTNKDISGGIFGEVDRYIAYSCCNTETFVEEFDDIVEAAKYASGIMAKTINGDMI